jgi:hypothetical protein
VRDEAEAEGEHVSLPDWMRIYVDTGQKIPVIISLEFVMDSKINEEYASNVSSSRRSFYTIFE